MLRGSCFVSPGKCLGGVSMPGGGACVLHGDVSMLQKMPGWLGGTGGCSREVLECPGQVLGDMHGFPSKWSQREIWVPWEDTSLPHRDTWVT